MEECETNNPSCLLPKCDNDKDTIYHGVMWFLKRYGLLIIAVIVTLLAIVLREAFFSRTNGDIYWYQVPWTQWYRDNGGLLGIGTLPISFGMTEGAQFPYGSQAWYESVSDPTLSVIHSDYLMGYLNLLALFSYLPIKSYAVCHLIATITDFASALAIAAIVWKVSKKDKLLTFVGYSIFLILPTIFTNSGIWGQCDGLYTCLALWAIYFVICKKPWIGMLFLGFALGTKLQAIFIIPVFGFLWLRKEFKLWWLLLIPVGMFIMMIPALIGGMSFSTLIGQYTGQAGSYPNANYNSGSFYVIFTPINASDVVRKYINYFGISLCLIVLISILVVLYVKRVKVNHVSILGVCALFAIVFPFFLPHMHERYFYMADVFIFLYCLFNKKRFWLVLLMQFSSFNSYTYFLFGNYFLPTSTFGNAALYLSMFANAIIICVLMYDLLHMEKYPEKAVAVDNKI
jgi:Gpi18-like mannosyltransferase